MSIKMRQKGLVSKKPQSSDARKEESINEQQDVSALSWIWRMMHQILLLII